MQRLKPIAGECVVSLLAVLALTSRAAEQPTPAAKPPAPIACTSSGGGYLRAKIDGAIKAEIDWGNQGTTCTGEVRPNGGVRVSFKNQVNQNQTLLIVFGIPGLQEGRSADALPVNLTVVREGAAEFYSTQGEDKCTIDTLRQEAIKAAPRRQRVYRVIVRGFCTEPARAVSGNGSVFISRFDFAGELHFDDADESQEDAGRPQGLANDKSTRGPLK
jgi:hypothetical protein